jgi:hypothetical protein
MDAVYKEIRVPGPELLDPWVVHPKAQPRPDEGGMPELLVVMTEA